MKKTIILSVLALALVLAPFSISFAKELTKAQVQTLVPSLTQVVSSLNNIIQNELVRRNMERASLTNLTPVVNSIYLQVSQSGNSLTPSQMSAISGQISSVQNVVSGIINRRAAFNNAIRPVVSALGSIATTIASAR